MTKRMHIKYLYFRSPLNGNHFSTYNYISREISIEHPSVGLASLAQLELSSKGLIKGGRTPEVKTPPLTPTLN